MAGITGRLGRIANVTRKDTAALSREVPLDLAAIQGAWPAFESGFDSLRGRRMMGLIDNRAGTYRLCTENLPRDKENPLGLDETTIQGGRYLRLRLIGDPPGVYGKIAEAFDELFEHADHDPHVRSSSSIDVKARSTASSQSTRPILAPEGLSPIFVDRPDCWHELQARIGPGGVGRSGVGSNGSRLSASG